MHQALPQPWIKKNYTSIYAGGVPISLFTDLRLSLRSFSILREEPIRLFILGNDDSKSLPYQALVEELDLSRNVVIRNDLSFSNGKLNEFLINYCDLALGNFGSSAKAKTVLVNKIIDSLAIGLPCLTMRTESSEELISEGAILYCEPTPENLASMIRELVGNRNLLKEVSLKALAEYKSKFSQDVFRQNISNILNSI